MKESRAKAFMFTCVGILAICIAVQVVMPATAQYPDNPIVAAFRTDSAFFAVTADGDWYSTNHGQIVAWYHIANSFDIQNPISNTDTSLGDVKKSFR